MDKARRIWLIVPMWLLFAVDVSLTLNGQSREYWDDNDSTVVEANPLAHLILGHGPWLFVGLAIAWAIFLGVLTVCCSHPLVKWFAIGAAVLHAVGGCSWMVRHGGWGWFLAVGYLVLASEMSKWCWQRANKSRQAS